MVPRRIVVGVDFSETAARAVREARVLATRLGAVLEIVHIREEKNDDRWKSDEAVLAWLGAEGLCTADVTTRSGIPWLELVRVARSPGADMLVLGTHGRSGAQPLALGTTASRVVLASPRPVLLVGDRGPGAAPAQLRSRERRPPVGRP